MDIGKLTTIFDAETSELEKGAASASASVKKAEIDISQSMASIDLAIARAASEAAAQFISLANAEGVVASQAMELLQALGPVAEMLRRVGGEAQTGLTAAQKAWETGSKALTTEAKRAAEGAIHESTQFYNTIERGRQAFVANLVKGAEDVSSQTMTNYIRDAKTRVKTEQDTSAEVLRIQAQTAKQAAEQQAIRMRAAKVTGDPTGAFTGIPQQGIVQIREAKNAADDLSKSLKESAGQTTELGVAQVALGSILANVAVQAFERLASAIYETITGAVLYAARTEELGVALIAIAHANHISTAEILGQEQAIKQLNLTTQDTRQILGRIIIAQLDYAQAWKLASAAQDLAVISGKTTQEELQQLTHGIITLQSRVLRNAGIFTTAEEAEKKYAASVGKTIQQLSTHEKQQAVLTEVLLQGARAVGTYDAAMTTASKQLRSMERLQAEAANTIGGFFQGILKAGIAVLSQLLILIGNYPGGVALVTAAIGALTVAFISLNTTLIATSVLALRAAWTSLLNVFVQAIPQVILLGKVMIAQAGLIQGALATTAAATAGWTAVILAAGAAIYYLTQATDALPEVDERALLATQNLITAIKDDLKWFENLNQEVQTHVEYLGHLEGGLRRLDPITAGTISHIKDETAQRTLLVQKLREQLLITQSQQETEFKAVIIVGTQGLEEFITAQKAFDESMKKLEDLRSRQRSGENIVSNMFGEPVAVTGEIRNLETATANLAKTVIDGSPKFQAMSRHLADAAKQAGQTAEEFLLCRSETNQLSESQLGLARSAQFIIDDLRIQEERYRGVAGAIQKYKDAIEGIKPPDLKISSTTEGVMEEWKNLSENFINTWQGLTAQFFKEGKNLDGWKEAVKGFSAEFTKLDKATADVMGGGYGAFIKTLPQTIQDARAQAAQFAASAGTIKSYSEQVVDSLKKQDEARKKQERDIKSLQDTLIEAINAQQEKQAELTDGMGKGANAVRDLSRWYAKLSDDQKNLITQTPKLLELYQNLQKEAQKTKEAQKGAQIDEVIKAAMAEVEKIQAKIIGIPEEVNVAATAYQKITKAFEDAGGAASATGAQYEIYRKILDQLVGQEKTLGAIDRAKMFEQVKDGIRSIETAVESLVSGRRTTELERFTAAFANIKGISIPEASVGGLITATEAAVNNAEKFKDLVGIIRGLITLSPGVKANELEATANRIATILTRVAVNETAVGRARADIARTQKQIDDGREALADKDIQASLRKLNVDGERLDLEVRLKRLQDQRLDDKTNQDLRIQVALLEDIVNFRRRDEQAIIAENRAQIELADKFIFHAQQARAIILETFARAKSVTEIWADTITTSVDTLVNSVESLMDRLMARLGVFGQIFGQIIKQIVGDLTRLLVQKAIMRLLNIASPEQTAAAAAAVMLTAAVTNQAAATTMTVAAGLNQVAADTMMAAAVMMAGSGGGGEDGTEGKGGLKGLLGAIVRGVIGGAAGGIGGGGSKGGGMPGTEGKAFGMGGYISPGEWAIVGDRGPEPAYGGQTGLTVLPNSVMGSNSGAKNINLTINVNDSRRASSYQNPHSDREIAERVGSLLQRHLG